MSDLLQKLLRLFGSVVNAHYWLFDFFILGTVNRRTAVVSDETPATRNTQKVCAARPYIFGGAP
jgi:hypothetical protein